MIVVDAPKIKSRVVKMVNIYICSEDSCDCIEKCIAVLPDNIDDLPDRCLYYDKMAEWDCMIPISEKDGQL